MQRVPTHSNGAPPAKKNEAAASGSPAFIMARRIRAEQGTERARQYLLAMEPYLAPAERAHIAELLGIPLPRHSEQQPKAQGSAPAFGGFPGMDGQNAGMGGQNPNGMNPMQLMQMMSAFSGKGGGFPGMGAQASPGGMDPMMMAQLFGMLGGKGGKK